MANNPFTLDVPPISFDEIAFLSILSNEPDYVLADDLNQLFDLDLRRIKDLFSLDYPHYLCEDRLRNLIYHLVQIKGDTPSYLLIVMGTTSDEEVRHIYKHFTETPEVPNNYDIIEVERYNIWQRYNQAFTVLSVIEFTDEELDAASSRRRILKGRAALADLYARILDSIDIDSIENRED